MRGPQTGLYLKHGLSYGFYLSSNYNNYKLLVPTSAPPQDMGPIHWRLGILHFPGEKKS